MTRSPRPLLSVRAALVVLGATVVGLTAGVLGYFAYGGVSAAVLTGGGAAGGTLALVHSFLERR